MYTRMCSQRNAWRIFFIRVHEVSMLTYSGRGIRKNRAHCDRNLTFGTMIEYDKTKILRYRAIAGLSLKQNGRRQFLFFHYITILTS